MELKLKPKHKKVSKEDNVVDIKQLEADKFLNKAKEQAKVKSGDYDTTKDKYICESYLNDKPNKEIIKNAEISTGYLYTVLRKYGIKEKRFETNKVYQSVKHITDDSDKLNAFIQDYYLITQDELFWKYKIHKNGVYYILDMLDLPRKKVGI